MHARQDEEVVDWMNGWINKGTNGRMRQDKEYWTIEGKRQPAQCRWFWELKYNGLENAVIEQKQRQKNVYPRCITWIHTGVLASPSGRSIGTHRISWDKPPGQVPWGPRHFVARSGASYLLQKQFVFHAYYQNLAAYSPGAATVETSWGYSSSVIKV